jgi:hypothetical protein
MPGPAPKRDSERRRTNKPVTGWNKTPEGGWQHDKVPPAPDGTSTPGKRTWKLWFSSWWAFWWSLEDVPQLELALKLWERAQQDMNAAPKFQALADSLGLTPKGRYALRLLPPDADEAEDEKPAEIRRLKVVDKTA